MSLQLKLVRPLVRPLRPLAEIPPLLSFFTGAGFLDLGMMQAGFRTVWSLELGKQFCEAHDYGMERYFSAEALQGKPPCITCRDDIQRKGPLSIRREAFGTVSRGDDFGIIGGPPCPDFSTGGKNRGEKAERGRLTRVFVERICELAPSFFVIENVKGLVSTHRHRKFLTDEIWKLEEKGYAVDLRILNALDLGIPQDRERVFIVGVKRSLLRKMYSRTIGKGERGWFPWPSDAKYHGAKSRFAWPTTSPFGSKPARPEGIPEELFIGPLVMDQKEIEKLPNGMEGFEPYSDKFRLIPEGDDSRKSFKRLHRYRYSPTAAYGNNEVHLHPAFPRRLRVREALRIQTVPDSFALPPELPLSTKFKLIGNGVAVRLATHIGTAIVGLLTDRVSISRARGGRSQQNER